MEAIHRGGWVQRDIRPGNCGFDRNSGQIKIDDFGIARKRDEEGMVEGISGTYGYMSPEVIFKKKHGPSADYFAIGVLLYELLKGNG